MDNEYAIPGDVWYYSLWSFVCLTWIEIKRGCSRFTAASTVTAISTCVCLPCCVIYGVLCGRRTQAKFGHSGIVYFYILLCTAVVFNLWQVITKPTSQSVRYLLLDYYGIVCMWLSILALCYIKRIANQRRLGFDRQRKFLTFYLRTGLYIFGVLSIFYSLCLFMNQVVCKDGCCVNLKTRVLSATLEMTKALFILSQILFLNRFYAVKLPVDTAYIQIVLAHLLGTNLTFWFWVLGLEVHNPGQKICREFPIPFGRSTDRYFYPILVEYLLLAASMFYEIWSNLEVTQPLAFDIARLNRLADYDDDEQSNDGTIGSLQYSRLERPLEDPRPPPRDRRNNEPVSNGGTSLIFGLSFGVVFIVFVIASEHVGKIEPMYYKLFSWITCVIYLSQILVCFVLYICIQTQRPSTRNSIDYDDALLYIGLAGIILWEGFHFYGLATSSSSSLDAEEVIVDFLGPVEYFTQTVTLISIRRLRSTNDSNSKWICYGALFLLATNFATWCQDTFFIKGSNLEKPGESHKDLEQNWEVLAHILNPLIIFFRFQSATCCYHVWTLFNGRNEQQPFD